MIIASSVKELACTTKMLADAVKTRDEKAMEVDKLRVCVQGLNLFRFHFVVLD